MLEVALVYVEVPADRSLDRSRSPSRDADWDAVAVAASVVAAVIAPMDGERRARCEREWRLALVVAYYYD